MPVTRIEKIVRGVVVKTAERAKAGPNAGSYVCLAPGMNIHPTACKTLDDAAAYLRANSGAGMRMNPGFGKIVDDIHIDGIPL